MHYKPMLARLICAYWQQGGRDLGDVHRQHCAAVAHYCHLLTACQRLACASCCSQSAPHFHLLSPLLATTSCPADPEHVIEVQDNSIPFMVGWDLN